ncbi:ABC transporter ATP-binding protein [Armatimonas sp.]|uniref:ABC transporter ATP-binding protein n=1 Tax=Armatimonas sp. TaxID=1872638 RepID=UPI00286BE934|nr:ABC transporter ATP-binding protein [Armatimonas sp.]
MASVRVEQLIKKYDQVVAVKGMDLSVEDGEFMVFLGPSGCGKTTTLRCIAGLELPDGGTIRIGEEEVTHKQPAERDIAFVFQSFSLYPHMTVRENLSFPLRAVKTAQSVIDERVMIAARMLHITDKLDRKPTQLSGGEQQRVTIGRAIVRRPQVFLMDEPLSALDAKLRTEMRAEIKKLQTDLGATTIYVTHDQLEAMSMGDRIAIMYVGLLQQAGTPMEVYDNPRNLFVAGFIGSPAMNFVPCQRSGDSLLLIPTEEAGKVELSLDNDGKGRFASTPTGETSLVLGVRPEDIAFVEAGMPGSLPVTVEVVELLGSENIINVALAGHIVKVRTTPTFRPALGQILHARINQSRSHLFDKKTELNINAER